MEIFKVIIAIVIGAVVTSATYSTIQYFRLYRPMVKAMKSINCSVEKEEA